MKKIVLFLAAIQAFCAGGPVVLVVGTRPEAIKMAPVYQALQQEHIPTLFCSTGQHADLLQSEFSFFQIEPDFSLQVMKRGQDVHVTFQKTVQLLGELFQKVQPRCVLVQGDTTSALGAAMAAFYLKIPVGHVEAGLRSGKKESPFPEEMHRRLISQIASLHFAPTQTAFDHLLQEGIDPETLFLTGNPVVDSCLQIGQSETFCSSNEGIKQKVQELKEKGSKILLLTAHRRESFPEGLRQIFSGVQQTLHQYPDLTVIYLTHPNPAVQAVIQEEKLSEIERLWMHPPLPYVQMIHLLKEVDFIATDSGGIQEEATVLQKPVLVLRNETDRPEAIEAKVATLVGTDPQAIVAAIGQMMQLQTPSYGTPFLYGDGHAGERIAQIIRHTFYEQE